jgi:hypothetical protein
MSNKGLSKFIPNAVLDAYKPVLGNGWETAAALYVAALWLSFIGSLIVNFSFDFRTGTATLAGTPEIALLTAVSIVVLTLVIRARAPHSNAKGIWLLDAALTLFFVLGIVAIVLGVIGVFASFGNGSFSTVLGGILYEIAGIGLGIVAVVWSLSELGGLRSYEPATGVTTASTSTGWATGGPVAPPTASTTVPAPPIPPIPPSGPAV